MPSDPRAALPSVDRVLQSDRVRELLERHPRDEVVAAIRESLAERRRESRDATGLEADVARRIRPSLRRVINATGVVLHTNLGRAPLAEAAIDAAVRAAGACTLEWDPSSGERGSRHDHVGRHLRALTGAAAACVVNTNAGAVLLALCSLGGGEVLVSRGQLVEIGGGFRIPDVLEASGLRLVEVGTTNRTRIADYERAITDATVGILQVHQSNFRTVGFVAQASLGEMAALARRRGLCLIDDLGSGVIDVDPRLPDEPAAGVSVAAGSDLVCFSADKLLGGPQAGLIVGTTEAVARCAAHPLMRALRPDKLTLAALEATLSLHRDPEAAWRDIPALRMIGASSDERRACADRLAAATGGEVVSSIGRAGGGTMPMLEIPSWAVAIDGDPKTLATALRAGDPAVAGRIADGRLLLDVVALTDADIDELPGLIAHARA